MASFTPTNAPRNLTMIDFKSINDSFGSLAKSCRYVARIVPSSANNPLVTMGYGPFLRDMMYLCDATEFPGRGMDILETRYYGPAINFPRNSKYSGELSMSFLVRNEAFERQLFDDWMEIINPTNTFDFEYARNYWAEIQIYQYAEAAAEGETRPTSPKPIYLWTIHQAWPVQVSPQEVTWADGDILRLSVTFTYKYWSRPRDTPPET